MLIPDIFQKYTPTLKDILLKQDKSIKTHIVNEKYIFKYVPELKTTLIENNLEDYLTEIVYCLLTQISEIPNCPICNKPLHLRNFKKGFNKFCSKACLAKWQSTSPEFKHISHKSHPSTAKIDFLDAEHIAYHKSKNYIVLENYLCKGDISVYFKTLKEIHNIGSGTYSVDINKEIYANYGPSNEEIEKFQSQFNIFYQKYAHRLTDKFWMLYFPYEKKMIETYFTRYVSDSSASFQEKMFFFKSRLTARPQCQHPNCNHETHYVISGQGYTQYCTEHINCFHSTSQGETEIRELLDNLKVHYVSNARDIIDGELDIYVPDHKLAIEFNGCYYHSDIYKAKDYHRNKWLSCQKKGIKLLSIWEDNWLNKREICEDLIRNSLGLNKSVGARKCDVREVSPKEAKEFLQENHLQGWCQSMVRLGLFYKDSLVALMTFGTSRFKQSEQELLRYCCKQGLSIIGGAGKLLSHFRDNYDKDIISYCDCDISDGKMYRALGMQEVGWSESWTWLVDGQRIYRLNSIRKDSNVLKAKCYSCGTLKFKTIQL